MRGRGAFAAAVAALLLIPATATAAPPPGAAISDNLDYVTRVAGAAGITEGKFDKVRGKKVLVVTGRFGFKTYDVSNPEARRCSTSSCRRASRRRIRTPAAALAAAGRLLAGRGHGARHEAQADHRRARPAARRHGPRRRRVPARRRPAVSDPDCKSGFYVISYADPANMRQVGDFVSLPSGTRRAASTTASTSGPAARRGAPTRTGWARRSRRSGPSGHAQQPPDRRRPADLGHGPA